MWTGGLPTKAGYSPTWGPPPHLHENRPWVTKKKNKKKHGKQNQSTWPFLQLLSNWWPSQQNGAAATSNIRDRLIRELAFVNWKNNTLPSAHNWYRQRLSLNLKVKVPMKNLWPCQTASPKKINNYSVKRCGSKIQEFSIWYKNLPLSSHYLSFRKQKIKRMIGNCVNLSSTIRGLKFGWLPEI